MSFIAPPIKLLPIPRTIPIKIVTMKGETAITTHVKLDRDAFSSTLKVFALHTPPKVCQTARKFFKDHLLTIPKIQVVAKISKPGSKSLLLLTRYVAEHISSNTNGIRGNLDRTCINFPAGVAEKFTMYKASCPDALKPFVSSITESSLTTWSISLTYAQCSIEHVLKTLLPSEIQVPTSFETVGHIAHINLREEHIPWKKIIGQVMLDKLAPRIRTIVNKMESTGGPYRTFAMEVLSGDHNLITSVKENSCIFSLDFENVYWNSRLETEHRRIVETIEDGDIFVDAFCGVGPFAIPAAKRAKCSKVYANDLNPSSIKYLNENIKKNKIPATMVTTSCMCARDFITQLVKNKISITTIVMNYPSGAPEFLDVFKGLYNEWSGSRPIMPIIYCYCFVKGQEDTDTARDRIKRAIFEDTDDSLIANDKIKVRVVRDVAPRKIQVCATFQIPEEVAFTSNSTRPIKRPKLNTL